MNPMLIEQLQDGDEATSSRFLDQLAYSEKMAELGQLAVGVIHEINTPLSVISAATQLIMREEGLPEHVLELLERIGSEAQRLSQMSRSMLTFGRLDGGETGEADINLVIRDVLQLLTYEIQKRSVTVTQSLDHKIPILQLNAGRLKQVFINLVMNSLHAMDGGGTIRVASIVSDDETCEIRVSDTGCGIAAADLENVFQPFYTTKEAGTGTGLGLFVTKEIVHAMKGSITVESHPGEGTCFTLRFPLCLE
jgi:two-component system NtrC family sensor kinase